MHVETHHADMLVYTLYPPIRLRYKQLGMYNLLHGEHDAILDPQANSSPIRAHAISTLRP